ncbi:MAG: hypothetical protein ABF260_04360 [Flavobacteriaceae bacterium]
MQLEIPIPVTFNIKMETERAYIVQDVKLLGKQYINEAVLPKKLVNILDDVGGLLSANVEKWVLQQRYVEENTVDVEAHINELLATV